MEEKDVGRKRGAAADAAKLLKEELDNLRSLRWYLDRLSFRIDDFGFEQSDRFHRTLKTAKIRLSSLIVEASKHCQR